MTASNHKVRQLNGKFWLPTTYEPKYASQQWIDVATAPTVIDQFTDNQTMNATNTTELTREERVIWRDWFLDTDHANFDWDLTADANGARTAAANMSNSSLRVNASGAEWNWTAENFTCCNLTSTDDHEDTIEIIRVVSTAIVLGLIILSTVIGNVFVIAAILLERNLQSVANYLILSLAVADLLVACLVMPLSAVYEVSRQWTLGPELCDMWTSSDVLCCTASILHLVAIALDRYWAVTNVDYIHHRTSKRIGLMILVVWSVALMVCAAPLLGWKDPEWNYRVNQELTCLVSQDVGYQIFATASSFYLPLLVILILYWRIFQTARKRIRRRQLPTAAALATGPKVPAGSVIAAASGTGGLAAAVVTIIGRPMPTMSEATTTTTTAFTNVSSTSNSPEKTVFGNGVEVDAPTADYSTATVTYQPSNYQHHPIKRKKDSTDSKRERKAAKTLAIITGAFVICWLPFFIMALLLPLCQQCDINPILMSLFLWLGYFNSTLNPVIYTIFSPEFRQAFKRILCGRRGVIRRHNNRHFKRNFQ